MRLSTAGAIFSAMAAALCPGGAAAQQTTAEARLFPDPATACFAAGLPAAGPLSPLSRITSLIVRPRMPDIDGDGDYPPDVEGGLDPVGPEGLRLTLIAAFAASDGPAPGRRWGSRFSCEPRGSNRDRLVCIVDDWCADVGFDLRIEGTDTVWIDVLPDAGPLGELGNPCGDGPRQAIGGASNTFASYRLDRQPAQLCR